MRKGEGRAQNKSKENEQEKKIVTFLKLLSIFKSLRVNFFFALIYFSFKSSLLKIGRKTLAGKGYGKV